MEACSTKKSKFRVLETHALESSEPSLWYLLKHVWAKRDLRIGIPLELEGLMRPWPPKAEYNFWRVN